MLHSKQLAVVLLVAGLCLSVTSRAEAQVGPAVRSMATELLEFFGRSGGRTVARELAEHGGEQMVREALEAAAAEGGEQLLRRSVDLSWEFGPGTLKAIRGSPARMVEAIESVPPGLRGAAVRAAAREPETMAALVSKLGPGALEASARHPGVGQKLVGVLGEEGVEVARRLDTDQVIAVLRRSRDIERMPGDRRAALVGALKQAPGETVELLEKNPMVLLSGTALAALAMTKDQMLGEPGIDKPGFLERSGLTRLIETPVAVISYAVWILGGAATVFGLLYVYRWGRVQLRGTLRSPRA